MAVDVQSAQHVASAGIKIDGKNEGSQPVRRMAPKVQNIA